MHCFLLKRPYAPSPDIGRTTHPAVAPQAWPRQSSKRVRILVSLEPKTRQHARRSGADAGDARALVRNPRLEVRPRAGRAAVFRFWSRIPRDVRALREKSVRMGASRPVKHAQ